MRLFFCTYFAFLTTISFGQKIPLMDDPFVGLPMRDAPSIQIDSLNQLPSRIQWTVSEILNSALTEFRDQIVFKKGQILDLDAWARKDSSFQVEYFYIIPKYDLYFELSDTLIGIKRYCLELSLDQYGQITYFNWPREKYNTKAAFKKPEQLMKTARKYARKKRYKTNEFLNELRFNQDTSQFCWHFSFLQSSAGDAWNYYKEYKTIVVDASQNCVVGEYLTHSAAVSCGG